MGVGAVAGPGCGHCVRVGERSEADVVFFFFSSRRRHTGLQGDWSSDVCPSDLQIPRPFCELSVLQNIALPPMFGRVAMDRRRAEEEAWRWLEFTNLSDKADRYQIGRASCRERG